MEIMKSQTNKTILLKLAFFITLAILISVIVIEYKFYDRICLLGCDDDRDIFELNPPQQNALGDIVGGEEANIMRWKWMAAIVFERTRTIDFVCGGSLISSQHILTAAHCLLDKDRLLDVNQLRVRLGSNDLTDSKAKVYHVESIDLAEPRYKKNKKQNDIAIIKLNAKVEFNENISAIKLPMKNTNTFEMINGSQTARIAGWGRTSFEGEYTNTLAEGRVTITSLSECQKSYSKIMVKYFIKNITIAITDQQLCARSLPNSTMVSDACQGDSGGPLIQLDTHINEYILTGVVSFGYRCADPQFPGVYVRVGYFLDWINKVINR